MTSLVRELQQKAPLDSARDEARRFEEIADEFELEDLEVHVRITDEERYGQAMARLETAARLLLLQEESLALGVAFKEDAKYADAISTLTRYEAAIERSLYRALHELQRVQAARKDGQSPQSIAVDVTVDGPSPASGSDD